MRRTHLIKRRNTVGLSQEKLAEVVGVDRTTVSRWENGETFPQPGQRPTLAEALQVSVEQLQALLAEDGPGAQGVEEDDIPGLLPAAVDRQTPAVQPLPEPALTWPGETDVDLFPQGGPLRHLLHQLDAVADGRDDWGSPRFRESAYVQLVEFLVRWAHTMNRRELLRMLGWAATAAVGAPGLQDLDEDESERLARAIQRPSRVDNQVIDHIAAVLQRCRRQDDALGPQAVLDTVLAQRSLVRGLLPDTPAPVRDRLLSVYGDLSRHAGWLSFDLNHHDAAASYYEAARTAAHEARDTELAAFVLCNLSQLAMWRGQARIGIDHAVNAEHWADRTDDLRLQAFARDRAALALARDGQRAAALSAMEEARLLLSQADTERPSLAYFLGTNGRGLGSNSTCYLILGDFMAGAAAAEEDLAGFDEVYVRSRALTTLRLGICRLRSPQPDVVGAAQAIGEAGALAVQNRSVRLVQQLRRGAAELEPWRKVSEVRRVRRDLAAQVLI